MEAERMKCRFCEGTGIQNWEKEKLITIYGLSLSEIFERLKFYEEHKAKKEISRKRLIEIIKDSKVGETLENHYLLDVSINHDPEMYEAEINDLADAILLGLPAKPIMSREQFRSIMCEHIPSIAEDSKQPEWSQGELDRLYDVLFGIPAKVCPEQLHQWYLEATKKLHPESFNAKAQVAYKYLTEEQQFIDKYIADKINGTPTLPQGGITKEVCPDCGGKLDVPHPINCGKAALPQEEGNKMIDFTQRVENYLDNFKDKEGCSFISEDVDRIKWAVTTIAEEVLGYDKLGTKRR